MQIAITAVWPGRLAGNFESHRHLASSLHDPDALSSCLHAGRLSVPSVASLFFLEISFITHSTEEKARFGPKEPRRRARERWPDCQRLPTWRAQPFMGLITWFSGMALCCQ